MQTFREFVMWYSNKDVEHTLEFMRKIVDFYHSKRVEMLLLEFTLLNLANRFLRSSTDAAFFPFCEMDKDYDNCIQKWLTGGTLNQFYTLCNSRGNKDQRVRKY